MIHLATVFKVCYTFENIDGDAREIFSIHSYIDTEERKWK